MKADHKATLAWTENIVTDCDCDECNNRRAYLERCEQYDRLRELADEVINRHYSGASLQALRDFLEQTK